MSKTTLCGFALLLVALIGCAAPPQSITPTPTTEPPNHPTTELPTHLPTAPPTSIIPTRAPTRVPPPPPTPEPLEIVYAIEPLEVLEVQPAHDQEDVEVERERARIGVRFNFPVVPLSSVNLPNVITQPLTIEPALEFEGRWLNSFTYAITPTKNLEAATQYTVTVKPMQDVAGRVSVPHSWTFKTILPRVLNSEPQRRGSSRVRGITQPITVTFNAEMDRASVETRLRVMRKRDRWAALGSFAWEGYAVRFTPTYPYEYDTEYVVELARGAQDINHRAELDALNLNFFTVKPFTLLSTLPQDGEKETKVIREEHAGLTLKFTQPVAENDLRVSVMPTLTNRSFSFDIHDWRERKFYVQLMGNWQAATTYTVTIGADTRSVSGEMLGRETVIHFTTAPLKPSLAVNLPAIGLFDANAPQTIYTSHTNLARIEYELYRVPRAVLLKLLQTDYANYSTLQDRVSGFKPAALARVGAWTREVPRLVNARGIISFTLSEALGKPLDADVYLLRVIAPELERVDASLILISPHNLALKLAPQEALVWVTDLASGKPVANQNLKLYVANNMVLAQGKSDRDGIFRAALKYPHTDYSLPYIVVSESDDGRVIAAAASDWNKGITTWDFELMRDGVQDHGRLLGNLYTDRAVYRAGQTVYFRGIVRRNRDPLLPPSVQDSVDDSELYTAKLEVTNSQGEHIGSYKLAMNEFGAVHGKVVLNENAPTGRYYIGGKGALHGSFLVEEYRKPEFQVAVNTDKTEYRNGETISFNVKGEYFFGGPVADARVTWRVLSQDYYARPAVEGEWEFFDTTGNERYWHDEQPFGKQIHAGEGRTDAAGNFQLDLPADLKEFARAQTWTLEAEIVDLNQQAVANRVSVPIHSGAFYIGLHPRSYVGGVNKLETIDVITIKASVNQKESLLLPAQAVTVSIYEGKWFNVRETHDGYTEWKSVYSETLLAKTEVVTDEFAKARVTFTPPRGGQYRIAAEGRDERGNVIKSAA